MRPVITSVLITALTAVSTAAPAHAAVRFDFADGTGSVDAVDLRQSLGWDEPTLRARAADLKFTKGTLIQDVYAVVCGPSGTPPVRTVHARQFATEFLTRTIDRGPTGEIRAIRLTGPDAGISGTTAPPTPDHPCPAPPPPAAAAGTVPPRGGTGKAAPAPPGTVSSAVVVSTTTTLTLTVKSGDVSRDLMETRTGPPIPA